VTEVVSQERLRTLEVVLDGLMRRYRERVPDVAAIINTLINESIIQAAEDIENDHIAFRTLGVPHLGIASLEKIFLHFGYTRRDYYNFSAKKLDAYWYAPPEPEYPRIFISELRVPELSTEAQRIVHAYTSEVIGDPVDRLNLDNGLEVDGFLHMPLWRTPTWDEFQQLQQESEYAAWVIYNRYYLNHFTISVHNLPAGYNTIEQFNVFLEAHGFKLNDSGGKAKKSPDGKLIQSSTVAQMVDADFADGLGGMVTKQIPGSYVEFAERKVLDTYSHLPAERIIREHRREGFEAGNADKIFESTYSSQTKKR